MKPRTGPWSAWDQAYLCSGGAEICNIPHYSRWHQSLFRQLTREEQCGAEGVEGFHISQDDLYFLPEVRDLNYGASITGVHKLHFSLLSAGKLLPCKYAALEIETHLTNDVNDVLEGDGGDTITQAFGLEDIQVLYNTMILEQSVLDSLYSALIRQKVMSVGTVNCHQICVPIPAGATSFSFSSVRAFSRLAQVHLTFRKAGPRSTSFICPGNLPGHHDLTYHEIGNTGAVPTARLSIGPHNWPSTQPASTAAEFYYTLIDALGRQPNISRKCFEEKFFCIAFDICKMPLNALTALSTRSGDLVHCQLGNLTANAATEVWVTLLDYKVIAIRESGITVLS